MIDRAPRTGGIKLEILGLCCMAGSRSDSAFNLSRQGPRVGVLRAIVAYEYRYASVRQVDHDDSDVVHNHTTASTTQRSLGGLSIRGHVVI